MYFHTAYGLSVPSLYVKVTITLKFHQTYVLLKDLNLFEVCSCRFFFFFCCLTILLDNNDIAVVDFKVE